MVIDHSVSRGRWDRLSDEENEEERSHETLNIRLAQKTTECEHEGEWAHPGMYRDEGITGRGFGQQNPGPNRESNNPNPARARRGTSS